MFEIAMFCIVMFFSVTGISCVLALIFLKISAPYEKKDFFVLSFSDGKDKEYVLWLKWLMTVFTILGIEEKAFFITLDSGMKEADRQEICSVFSEKKNVFVVNAAEKEEKTDY